MNIYRMTAIVSTAVCGIVLVAGSASADPNYPRPNEVNHRLVNQQARIDQGVHSGQLTWRETRNLEGRDDRVYAQESRDEAFHDGHLTRGEDLRLNSELNRDSRAIYRDKHNCQTR